MSSLQALIDVYIEPLRALIGTEDELASEVEIRSVFPNIRVIYQYNSAFLAQLEESVRAAPSRSEASVGAVFLTFAAWLRVYSTYINGFNDAMQMLRELERRDPAMIKFERAAERRDKRCFSGLPSLLITPVQRVPRYVMLLSQLVKVTPNSHDDHDRLVKYAPDFLPWQFVELIDEGIDGLTDLMIA